MHLQLMLLKAVHTQCQVSALHMLQWFIYLLSAVILFTDLHSLQLTFVLSVQTADPARSGKGLC